MRLAIVSSLLIQSTFAIVVARSQTSTTSSASAAATGKRGMAYSDPSNTLFFADYEEEVTWAYNWNYEGKNPSELRPNTEYIPLLYNANSDHTSYWNESATKAIANGATALMSFNEPDLPSVDGGSNYMSVELAVETWMTYMGPFAGKAKLLAPAVTNSGSPAGLTWLGYFIGNCTECTIDGINIHCYSNHWAGASYLEQQVKDDREIASGRDIWISEFGIANDDGTGFTQTDVINFLDTALP